jgi:transcriptional regulator with XRE-family HTH domain
MRSEKSFEEPLHDPEIRRNFEEELLVGEVTETVGALLKSLKIPQRQLAERLGVTPGRVSQVLSGAENLTLRSLGSIGWALGVRFDLTAQPMNLRGTPAIDDRPLPGWLERIGGAVATTRWHGSVRLPAPGKVLSTRKMIRVPNGEEAA